MISFSKGFPRENKINNENTIIRIFQKNAKKFAKRIAISQGKEYYLYREVDQLSDRIAYNLMERGIRQGDVVAIFMDRVPLFIITMLGILKCNATYLPLSMSYPKKRIELICETAQVKAIVVQGENFDTPKGIKVFLIEELIKDVNQENSVMQQYTYDENKILYILFTSGTTGKPKGVEIRESSIINLARSLGSYILTNDEGRTIGVISEFIFDVSEGQIYLALLYGHTLDIVPSEYKVIPKVLLSYMREKQYFCVEMTPTMLQMQMEYVENVQGESFPPLLVSCGEALPLELCKSYFAYNKDKDTVVLNCYGPTETCVYSSINKLESSDVENMTCMYLGKPIENTVLYVMDEDGMVCEAGEQGELYIGGIGVAKGYVNMKALTEERFVQNPYDINGRLYKTGDIAKMDQESNIEYFGRKDDQVKIKGLRIELMEIEDVMMLLPGIVAAKAKVYHEEERTLLVIYYIDKKNYEIDMIYHHLERYIPVYMIPNYFVPVEKFEYNLSGKLDSNKLPDYKSNCLRVEKSDIDYECLDMIEREFLDCCKRLLRKENLFLADSFLMAGGDSLVAVQLIIYIKEKWNVDMNMAQIVSSNKLLDILSYIHTVSKDVIIEKSNNKLQHELKVSSMQKGVIEYNYKENLKILQKNLVYLVTPDFYVEEEKFHDALDKTVEFQELLHMTFHKISSEYVMTYEGKCSDYYSYIRNEESIENIHYEAFLTDFDYKKLPLFHIYLLEDEKHQQKIVFNFSHLIFDLYSLHVILQDIFKYYYGTIENKKSFSITNYLFEKQNKDLKDEKNFWKKKLNQHKPVVCFQQNEEVKRLFIKKDDKYITEVFTIEGERLDKLREISRTYNIMEFLLLQASMVFLLYKLKKETDIILGVNLSGRNTREEAASIGLFTKLVPCRFSIDENLSIWDNIVHFQDEFYQIMEQTSFNIEEIYQCMDIADMLKGELFQLIMNYSVGGRISFNQQDSVEIKELSRNVVKVPVYIDCESYQDKLELRWTYVERLFSKNKTKEYIEGYINTIDFICRKNVSDAISNLM